MSMVEENTIDKSRNIHTWGEFSEIIKGNGVQKVDFVDEGYGCIHYGQIYTHYGPYTYNTNKFVSKEIFDKARKASKGDIIMTDTSENVEDICKSVAYLGNDDIAVSNHALIIKHNQNPKFLSYSTLTDSFFNQKRKVVVGVKVSGIKPEQLAKIKIYLPSLSEQERIVGILDTFTSSIDNLKQQIAQRRKQYEYYRDQLLDIEGKEGVEMKKIKDVCIKICSGGTPSTSKHEYYGGSIPWLRTQEVDWKEIYDTEIKITDEAIANSSAKIIPANCVIVAMYGATAAKVAINKIPLSTNQACCNLEIESTMALYRYVFYWLCKEYQNLKAMGEGSQNNINGQKVKDYPIPVPSLSEQQRIVDILDKFETSIQNLEAQLSQREKQYEYYRNKLLTFED